MSETKVPFPTFQPESPIPATSPPAQNSSEPTAGKPKRPRKPKADAKPKKKRKQRQPPAAVSPDAIAAIDKAVQAGKMQTPTAAKPKKPRKPRTVSAPRAGVKMDMRLMMTALIGVKEAESKALASIVHTLQGFNKASRRQICKSLAMIFA